MKSLRFSLLLVLVFALPACSTLQVKVERTRPVSETRLAGAVAAARSAWPQALAGDPSAVLAYNKAVAEVVDAMVLGGFVDTPEIPIRRSGKDVLNPGWFAGITPAANVRVKGLIEREVRDGIGVPVVLWAKKDSAILAGQPGIPPVGMTRPGTALLTFERGAAQFEILDTFDADRVRAGAKTAPLAVDFSAPIAVLLSKGQNRSIDVRSMFLSDREIDERSGLMQFQPYDPNKIPVIFVHGLMSRPEAWTQATNQLLADPEIRKKYQFWFFRYPTGLPVWATAALLRTEMDRFRDALDPKRQNPRLDEVVMIGHSMGGLVTSLMIREGGRKLWDQFATKPIDDLNLSEETKSRIKRLIFFAPRKDISRVIFVATPHRGSPLALRPISNFAAMMIRLPGALVGPDHAQLMAVMRDDVRSFLVAPANSIRFLKAESPLLLSILRLPMVRKIPYHSIVGDRGRGNAPEGGDGVVPYWSSHLDGATSEKIVPSGHGANENAEGIAEMGRILRENLKD